MTKSSTPISLTYVKKTVDSLPWKEIESGLKACSVTVTPAMAKEIMTLNEKNRRLSPSTVSLYAEDMKNNQWGRNASPISISNTYRLLDGQHRLAAVIASGKAIPFVFYHGQKNSDFQYIDGGRKRTAGDILGMTGIKNAPASAATAFLLLQHEINEVGLNNKKITRNAKTACAQIWDNELQKSILWVKAMRNDLKIQNAGITFAHFCIMNGKHKSKGKEFLDLFSQFLQRKISVNDLPGRESHPIVVLERKLKTYKEKHMVDSHTNRVMAGINIMEAFTNFSKNKVFKKFTWSAWPTKEQIGAFRVK